MDWCPLDLEAVTGFRSGRPASILQVFWSVSVTSVSTDSKFATRRSLPKFPVSSLVCLGLYMHTHNWTFKRLVHISSFDDCYGMVRYDMVNVDLYSAIITKVSNALDTLVSGEKPGFQTLSEGLVVLLCAEVVRHYCQPPTAFTPLVNVAMNQRALIRRLLNACILTLFFSILSVDL